MLLAELRHVIALVSIERDDEGLFLIDGQPRDALELLEEFGEYRGIFGEVLNDDGGVIRVGLRNRVLDLYLYFVQQDLSNQSIQQGRERASLSHAGLEGETRKAEPMHVDATVRRVIKGIDKVELLRRYAKLFEGAHDEILVDRGKCRGEVQEEGGTIDVLARAEDHSILNVEQVPENGPLGEKSLLAILDELADVLLPAPASSACNKAVVAVDNSQRTSVLRLIVGAHGSMVVNGGGFGKADQVADIVLVAFLPMLVEVGFFEKRSCTVQPEGAGDVVERVEASFSEGSPSREGNAVGARRRVAGQPHCFFHMLAGWCPSRLVSGQRLARKRFVARKEVVFWRVGVLVVVGLVEAGTTK